MNTKELRQILMGHLVDHCLLGSDTVQRRPYTLVTATFTFLDKTYSDYAFAKVAYPDEWDADEGEEVCLYRIAKIVAKRILVDVDRDAIVHEIAAKNPAAVAAHVLSEAIGAMTERIAAMARGINPTVQLQAQVLEALESNHPGVGVLMPKSRPVTLGQIRLELAEDNRRKPPSPGISE